MALNPLIQFPIFSSHPPHATHRATTEINLSRWNNANAQKFTHPKLTQKNLEDQIRSEKRFNTAEKLAHNYNPAPPYLTSFKSTGTPSSPSKSSIPAKRSKYSSNSKNNQTHPAFRPTIQTKKLPSNIQNDNNDRVSGVTVRVDEKGVMYEINDAPFVYQYSYTETPKVKPLKMREPLVSPFGPESMKRPWTGRKPLNPSKKSLPEFDSFKLPPQGKKGVKPVQSPGPFLEGTGPRYVKTREELLGEPLSKEEVEELIRSCQKTARQLNIGRDGLTHNMLDNIHAHWKRRRVCKIKCKGVCTVDMNNVHQQLEEKTGGKIIYSKGGVLYLFRGRNYNYRTRPRFPLMLWKPISPVYPRLVKHVPEGLTLVEATEMRKRGRSLIPICKLAKNGVYSDLAKHVREAFEACELVRINCQGLNGSDFRKIGAKLKDLVPCVLISFEEEHILVWRGRDWKSSLDLEDEPNKAGKSEAVTVGNGITNNINSSVARDGETLNLEECEELNIKESENFMTSTGSDIPSEASSELSSIPEDYKSEGPLQISHTMDGDFCNSPAVEVQSDLSSTLSQNDVEKLDITKPAATSILCTERVLKLRELAVETGSAIILAESDLNADTVFQKSIGLAKSAPPGPVFKYKPRRVKLNSSDEQKISNSEEEGITISEKDARSSGIKVGKTGGRTPRNKNIEDLKEGYLNIAPRGSLKVDELAKLLA